MILSQINFYNAIGRAALSVPEEGLDIKLVLMADRSVYLLSGESWLKLPASQEQVEEFDVDQLCLKENWGADVIEVDHSKIVLGFPWCHVMVTVKYSESSVSVILGWEK